MTRGQSELMAILSAALVPAFGLGVAQVLGDRTVEPDLGTILAWACLSFLVTLPITAAVWGSAVQLLDRFGWVNAFTASLAGASVGALVSLAFTYPALDLSPGRLLWSGLGMLSGLTFWLVRKLPAK
ncbi:hypothetical protein [Pseudomonas sp. CGJS7]|uniref:hypothetical protein n=1 Tax=Pseudomonas sp. CGJS7 TaxID=3109348 RepID=UPI0030099907